MERNKKQRILFVSPEVHPFVRTGGLADVSGSLPKALFNIGYQVAMALPLYRQVFSTGLPLEKLTEIEVPVGEEIKKAIIYQSHMAGKIPVFLVYQKDYFDRAYLYGDISGDYPDNAERFAFFCRAILEAIKQLNWKPDIIHCHDWQTALIPLYLKALYPEDAFFNGIGTLFTLHNLGFQGLFPAEKLKAMGLSEEFFVSDKLEFFGKINTLKAGLIYADVLNTVSPTYAEEIQTPDYGFGLDGILRKRTNDLYGILNGIDYQVWNPASKQGFIHSYSAGNLEGKKENKKDLQEINNLPVSDVPLVGMVSRLDGQKGFDLVAAAFEEMMKIPIQLVVLGWGTIQYHEILRKIGERFPEKTKINIGFELSLAKLTYAGSDILLMPSQYEPCGIAQMKGMHYGTIPVVRKTGGLADTVKEFEPAAGKGTGFLFENYAASEMINALQRAFDVYHNKSLWQQLVTNAMRQDFSWGKSVKEYDNLYNIILNKIR